MKTFDEKLTVALKDAANDYLVHYGVGHLDGGHSGRYAWGSGDGETSNRPRPRTPSTNGYGNRPRPRTPSTAVSYGNRPRPRKVTTDGYGNRPRPRKVTTSEYSSAENICASYMEDSGKENLTYAKDQIKDQIKNDIKQDLKNDKNNKNNTISDIEEMVKAKFEELKKQYNVLELLTRKWKKFR